MKALRWLLVLLFPLVAHAENISVLAFVDDTNVALHEQFQFTIQVKAEGNLSELGEPRLPDLVGLNLLGRQKGSSSSLSIVGGQVQRQVVQSFVYTLMAESTGRLQIGEAEVMVNGKRYTTKPITLQVTNNPRQTQKPRHNQGQGQPQQLDPFNGADPFNGMDPLEDEDLFVQQLLRRRGIDPRTMRPFPQGGQGGGAATPQQLPGVNTNDAFFIRAEVDKTQVYVGEQVTASWYIYTRNLIRDIDTLKYPDLKAFWKEDIEVATRLNFEDVVVNGLAYRRALLASYALFPIKAGTATIDSYKAKCTVLFNSLGMGGNAMTFSKASPELKVNVVALPVDNRPKDFTGAVGQFSIKTSVSSTRVETNQPFSFKIRIEGRGNAKMIDLPPMDLPPSLESFDQKTETKFLRTGESYKEFELLLIPRQPGAVTLPAVSVSVFDPKTKTYTQHSAPPINLVVGVGKPGENMQGRALDQGAKGPEKAPREKKLPGPIISSDRSAGLPTPLRIPVIGGLFVLVLLILSWRAMQELGWGRKRRDMNFELKKRFRIIRAHVDKRNYRAVGAETLNAIYHVLGTFSADESTSTMSLDKLLLQAPPSIRKEIEEPLARLHPIFESLSFAPESLIGELKEPSVMNKNVGDVERLLYRVVALSSAEASAMAGAAIQKTF